MIGNVPSTIGTAPRSPAHASTTRSAAANGSRAVSANTATGRATNISTIASPIAGPRRCSSPRGVTSSPSITNSATCATHAAP